MSSSLPIPDGFDLSYEPGALEALALVREGVVSERDRFAVSWFLGRWADETDEWFVEFAAQLDAFSFCAPESATQDEADAETERLAAVFVASWKALR